MRTDSEILVDLDRLRDSRGTISEDEYHLASDRLWDELRKHDRAKRRAALEKALNEERHKREEEQRMQEEALAERRNSRLAQAQRRLNRWVAQPTPTAVAELRSRLEEFLRIPASNNPDLRRRQARIKARLANPQPTPCSQESSFRHSLGRPLTDEERLLRRAERSGDKDKALEIAQRYHRSVKRLYRSQHAEIRYGPGGVRQVIWRGRYPTVWKDAGVWIDYSTQPFTVVLEDHRDQFVCRLQVPLELVTFKGLLEGDLWGIQHGSRVERWAMGEAVPVVVGFA